MPGVFGQGTRVFADSFSHFEMSAQIEDPAALAEESGHNGDLYRKNYYKRTKNWLKLIGKNLREGLVKTRFW